MTNKKNNRQSEFTRNGPPKMGGAFWFVVFHEDIDDQRLAVVAARAKVPRIIVTGFLTVLETHASRATDRGSVADFDVEVCSLNQGLEEETVKALLSTLRR